MLPESKNLRPNKDLKGSKQRIRHLPQVHNDPSHKILKSSLKTPVLKDTKGVNNIFLLYAIQQKPTASTPTFDQLNQELKVWNQSNYFKFCKDFKILEKLESHQLLRIFKNYSYQTGYITFKNFKSLLKDIVTAIHGSLPESQTKKELRKLLQKPKESHVHFSSEIPRKVFARRLLPSDAVASQNSTNSYTSKFRLRRNPVSFTWKKLNTLKVADLNLDVQDLENLIETKDEYDNHILSQLY